jgi:hypothetical protein
MDIGSTEEQELLREHPKVSRKRMAPLCASGDDRRFLATPRRTGLVGILYLTPRKPAAAGLASST